jgi:small subunit ribosomal protein S15
MALTTAATAEIVKTYQRTANDTGSSEVQIALLTTRIIYLTDHLKANKNDKHTGYGLNRLVSKRRKLLRYLKKSDPKGYRELLQRLELRG